MWIHFSICREMKISQLSQYGKREHLQTESVSFAASLPLSLSCSKAQDLLTLRLGWLGTVRTMLMLVKVVCFCDFYGAKFCCKVPRLLQNANKKLEMLLLVRMLGYSEILQRDVTVIYTRKKQTSCWEKKN